MHMVFSKSSSLLLGSPSARQANPDDTFREVAQVFANTDIDWNS